MSFINSVMVKINVKDLDCIDVKREAVCFGVGLVDWQCLNFSERVFYCNHICNGSFL